MGEDITAKQTALLAVFGCFDSKDECRLLRLERSTAVGRLRLLICQDLLILVMHVKARRLGTIFATAVLFSYTLVRSSGGVLYDDEVEEYRVEAIE